MDFIKVLCNTKVVLFFKEAYYYGMLENTIKIMLMVILYLLVEGKMKIIGYHVPVVFLFKFWVEF